MQINNSRQDIPLWTWYNGQFLFQFEEQLLKNPNQTMSQFFEGFLKNQEIQECNFYHTKNQSTVILLLYGLLVVPREIQEKNHTKFLFISRQKFTFNPPTDKNLDTLNFLRLLRNSVAHANFAIDTNPIPRLTFWNNCGNGTRNFDVEIAWEDFGEFLAEIGKYYINEVRKVKVGNQNGNRRNGDNKKIFE